MADNMGDDSDTSAKALDRDRRVNGGTSPLPKG
jgi:hypothetical protein